MALLPSRHLSGNIFLVAKQCACQFRSTSFCLIVFEIRKISLLFFARIKLHSVLQGTVCRLITNVFSAAAFSTGMFSFTVTLVLVILVSLFSPLYWNKLWKRCGKIGDFTLPLLLSLKNDQFTVDWWDESIQSRLSLQSKRVGEADGESPPVVVQL